MRRLALPGALSARYMRATERSAPTARTVSERPVPRRNTRQPDTCGPWPLSSLSHNSQSQRDRSYIHRKSDHPRGFRTHSLQARLLSTGTKPRSPRMQTTWLSSQCHHGRKCTNHFQEDSPAIAAEASVTYLASAQQVGVVARPAATNATGSFISATIVRETVGAGTGKHL
ncbi:hypothetical protein HPB50_015639 [Hyalomma asiaticum]|uniref:Uncharacterized protein n=1 Tax=Hyalomma asiaticum TaxID=266040 RepID=A0ACB7TIH1_HYAAI|nr:hypothetical protein HPB50_015639 [Hyalomma asiaticum]